MDKRTEKRSFRWPDFIREIEQYYDKQDCEFNLEIGADGSCIFRFDVFPRGKCYFHKLVPDDTYESWQQEAYAELKAIFFPTENVVVTGLYQWPEMERADVTLFVESINESETP